MHLSISFISFKSMAMSSAYTYINTDISSSSSIKFLIYRLNKVGLIIPPCMTPLFILIGV